ncbi:hypothetical protein Tco_1162339 [Tanacetum coccineum]
MLLGEERGVLPFVERQKLFVLTQYASSSEKSFVGVARNFISSKRVSIRSRPLEDSYALSAASRLRRNSLDICSPNGFDELLPPVLVVVSDLVFWPGCLDLSGPGGRGLASSPNKSSLLTLGTSPSVKSTGSGVSHLEWDRNISHASYWTNEIDLFSSRIVKKASVIAVFAMAISAVSAQEFASAPAPSPLAGAAYSVPASGVMIGTSILLSFVALFRN